MSQFKLKHPTLVRFFASAGPNYLAAPSIIFSSSSANQTGLSANAFVVKLIDNYREAALANITNFPPHVVKFISDDALFAVVRTFIVKFIFDKSWKVQTFEREAGNYIRNIFDAILSVDSAFRLPKGSNAAFMHKVVKDLSSKFEEI
jgi:hypothetical protein